jgi:hypothetical protein
VFPLRDFIEQRFEVEIDKNAAAGSRYPAGGGGFRAAMTNYGSFAHEVVWTDEAVGHKCPMAP